MARGTVVGEVPHSQANTEAFEDGYRRIFGDCGPQRGKWYQDPKTGALRDTPPDYEPTDGQRIPVFTDRYMEGTRATDGTDIGSRTKRRMYMQVNDLADADDFKGHWQKKAEERARASAGDFDHQSREEAFRRALHEVNSRKR